MSEEPERLFSAPEVRAAMALCDGAPTGVRDAALINVLWCSGIRCAEATAMLPEHVDRRRGTLWVALGKGGHSRLVVLPRPMLSELWSRIDAWCRIRPDGETLFCTTRGGRLDESYVRRLFRGLGVHLGFSSRFHPHILRHNFAAKMHLGGIDLAVIQHQLGHADLSMTGRYLRHIGEDVAAKAIADAPL